MIENVPQSVTFAIMMCTVLTLVLVNFIGTAWSLDLVDLLHQLPAPAEPFYCVVQSGRQRYMVQEVFEHFSKNGQQLVVVTTDDFHIPIEKISHFLITFDDDSWVHTELLFNNLFFHRGWNNLGYFIFLCGSDSSYDTLRKYAELMNMLGITKSLLIFSNYQPYGYDYFAKTIIHFTNVRIMIQHLQKDHLVDVQGYVLRISVVQFILNIIITFNPLKVEGSTAMFLEAFADHMNATIDWHVDVWHPSEAERQIINKRLDIITIRLLDSPLVDSVYENQFHGMVLLVPEKLRGSFFKHLLIPFTNTVWIFILILIIVCLIVNNILKRCLTRNILLIVFFGTAIAEHKLPRFQRSMFLTLSIVVFLLSEAYLAKMFSYIMNERYESHLESLEEFERTTIPLCINFEVEEAYRNTILQISPNLHSRLVQRNDSKEWHDMASCSWLVFHQMAELFVNYKLNHDPITLRKKLYMLPQILGWHQSQHSISRKGPFLKRFARTYQRVNEAGLYEHWKELTNHQYIQRKWSSLTVLGWDDLLSLWYILGYGFALSVVVLLGEIVFKSGWVFYMRKCGSIAKRGGRKIIRVKAIPRK